MVASKALSNATGLLAALAATSSDHCKALDRRPGLLQLVRSVVSAANASQRELLAIAGSAGGGASDGAPGASSDQGAAATPGNGPFDPSHRPATTAGLLSSLLLQPQEATPATLADAALVYLDQTKLWAARLMAALVHYWSVFAILHSVNFHDLPLAVPPGWEGAGASHAGDQWLMEWAAGAGRLTGG